MKKCALCNRVYGSFYLQDDAFVCRHCYLRPPDRDTCRLFEYGVENPMDKNGSTAHVRDIKARRIDPKTKTLFYYEKPKTYFFKK